MDYIQLTQEDRQSMLQAIGVDTLDDLYQSLPQKYRLDKPLQLEGLPQGLSELELQRRLDELAGQNRPAGQVNSASFLGGGAYDHFIPAVVDSLSGHGTFVTAYTPYQAEASQGSLQAFYEFQTQVCRLSGLDVANASLYEGATAAAEAVLMAINTTGRRRVLVAKSVHPHTLAVIRTYLSDLPAELIEVPLAQGRVDGQALASFLQEGKGDTACVVIQSPNVLGLLEDWQTHFDTTHTTPDGQPSGTLAVALYNPTAMGLFKRPGDCGADIAAADGQPLGIPLQFGGPYLGLFSARQALLRRMPGRLVGQTVDAQGRRGFCLTLQTREQHIRGAKATSNVCTNQGLLAIRATIYLSALGPQGLREVASQCFHKAHYAASQIQKIPGYSLAYPGEFFHEFVINTPVPAQAIIDAGRKRNIKPGLACDKLGVGDKQAGKGDHQLLVAVTEKRTRQQIDSLVSLLKECR